MIIIFHKIGHAYFAVFRGVSINRALFHLAADFSSNVAITTQQLSQSQEFPFAIVNSEARKFGIDFLGGYFFVQGFVFFFSFVGSSGNFVFSIVALIIPFT